ncbi:MAG: BTAD domain-containing putative transcriptional regulator [Polyangiales bacterium]
MTRARRRRRPIAPALETAPPPSAPPSTPPPARPFPALLPTLLGVATLWCLGATAAWIYDDLPLIVDTPRPASLDDVVASLGSAHWNNLPYYRPLSRATLSLARYTLGDDAVALKMVNAGFMVLLTLCTDAMLRARAFGLPRGAALLGAALVGVHPAAAECVRVASGGAESIAHLVCAVAAVALWVRGSPGQRAGAMALCAAAMLFKEQAVVIPALFVLADVLGLGDAPPPRTPAALLARHAPVALGVLGWFALRAGVLAHAEPVRFAALRVPARVPLAFLHTLHALLAPSPTLTYEPEYTLARAVPGAALAVVLAAGLARVTRGPAAAFGAGWALLAVLPTANLLTQETHFADRYALLAAPGLAAVVAAWAAPAWTDAGLAARRHAGLAAVVILAVITHARAGVFRDNETFLRHWARVEPSPYRALAALGEADRRAGRDRAAIETWERAVALDPLRARFLHRHLGMAWERVGDPAAAIRAYRRAVRADRRDAYSRDRLARLSASPGP